MSTNCRLERPTAVIIPAGRDAAMRAEVPGLPQPRGGCEGPPLPPNRPWARQPLGLRGRAQGCVWGRQLPNKVQNIPPSTGSGREAKSAVNLPMVPSRSMIPAPYWITLLLPTCARTPTEGDGA